MPGFIEFSILMLFGILGGTSGTFIALGLKEQLNYKRSLSWVDRFVIFVVWLNVSMIVAIASTALMMFIILRIL
jgi:hypothetical protein